MMVMVLCWGLFLTERKPELVSAILQKQNQGRHPRIQAVVKVFASAVKVLTMVKVLMAMKLFIRGDETLYQRWCYVGVRLLTGRQEGAPGKAAKAASEDCSITGAAHHIPLLIIFSSYSAFDHFLIIFRF